MNLNQSWIKHEPYSYTNGNKHTYIYIYIYIYIHKKNLNKKKSQKKNISNKQVHTTSKKSQKKIYQTNKYTLLQIKENDFIDKFKPKLNKTWTLLTHKWK